MQTLKLADDLFPALDAGVKRGTVRAGRREIELGFLRLESVSGEKRRDVEVARVSFVRARNMSQADADMDGVKSPHELFDVLTRFYPELTGDSVLTVIEFEN